MRRVIAVFSLFVLFFINPSDSNSTNVFDFDNDNTGELVIHFEGLSSKDASQIQTLISGINGLTFQSYCARLDVYLVTYDHAIFTTDEFALKAITNSADNLRPVLMHDATHESLNSHCH